MKISTKLLYTSLSLIVLGLTMVAIGFLGGGRRAIISDHNGFSIYQEDNIVIENKTLNPFQSIEIDAKFSNIRVIQGDHYGIEYKSYQNNEQISYQVENNKLTIKEEGGSVQYNFMINLGAFQGNEETYMTIYVPKDVELQDIKIAASSSEIKLEGIKGKSIDLNCTYGDIDLSDVTSTNLKVTMNSGDLDTSKLKVEDSSINNQYGDIQLRNFESKGLSIEANSGQIDIDGRLLGKTEIQCKYGDVKLDTTVSQKEYQYELKAQYGDVSVNGNRESENELLGNGGPNTLTIQSNSGDIDLNFQ